MFLKRNVFTLKREKESHIYNHTKIDETILTCQRSENNCSRLNRNKVARKKLQNVFLRNSFLYFLKIDRVIPENSNPFDLNGFMTSYEVIKLKSSHLKGWNRQHRTSAGKFKDVFVLFPKLRKYFLFFFHGIYHSKPGSVKFPNPNHGILPKFFTPSIKTAIIARLEDMVQEEKLCG